MERGTLVSLPRQEHDRQQFTVGIKTSHKAASAGEVEESETQNFATHRHSQRYDTGERGNIITPSALLIFIQLQKAESPETNTSHKKKTLQRKHPNNYFYE